MLAQRRLYRLALAQEYGRRLQFVRVVATPHDATAYNEAYERADFACPDARDQAAPRQRLCKRASRGD